MANYYPNLCNTSVLCFRRKLLVWIFIFVLTCVTVLYWTGAGLTLGLFSSSKSTSPLVSVHLSRPRPWKLNRDGAFIEGVRLNKKELIHAVDRLPFKIMSASPVLLEDLYFIPSGHRHTNYSNQVLNQPKGGCGDSSDFLLVFVPSPPDSADIRFAIRETWGIVARGRTWPWSGSGYLVKLIFVLGRPQAKLSLIADKEDHGTNDETTSESTANSDMFLTNAKSTRPVDKLYIKQFNKLNDERKLTQLSSATNTFQAVNSQDKYNFDGTVMKSSVPSHLRDITNLNTIPDVTSNIDIIPELEAFDDILQFDMIDSYQNLTRKIILALQWAVQSCPSIKYIMKADQDVFVNIPLLTTFLQYNGETNSIYGNIHANSWVQRTGKWAVSKSALPIPIYPIYAAGNAYILSKDAAAKTVELAPMYPYVPVEDAFITGVLASVGKVNRIKVGGFTKWSEDKPDPCDFVMNKRYVGNNFTDFDLRMIWRDLIDQENGQCDT